MKSQTPNTISLLSRTPLVCIAVVIIFVLMSGIALATDIYVSPAGSDATGNGTTISPYRTVTRALNGISGTNTINLASGSYSASTGEAFPLTLPSNTTLTGSSGAVIDASGNYSSVIVLNGSDSCTVNGISITGGFGELSYSIFGNLAGGIGTIRATNFTISNCSIYNNWAGFGGGICTASGNGTITGNDIYNNTSGTSGAGIELLNGTYTVSGNHIHSNSSGAWAGGIDAYQSLVDVSKNRIESNQCTGDGGGIVLDGPTGSIYNNLIYNNSATDQAGALYVMNTSKAPAVFNNTLTGNSSASGIYISSGAAVSLYNNIIWSNGSSDLVGSATYSDIRTGAISGTGNISADPKFGSDYQLLSTSPCIDKGTSSGAPSDDFAGNSRPNGNGYDIGAYEYGGSVPPPPPPPPPPSTAVLTSVTITPTAATVAPRGKLAFSAAAFDQNGSTMSGVSYSWTDTGGSVSPTSGSSTTYTAGRKTGSFRVTVKATAGSVTLTATATVTVTTSPPPPPSPVLTSVTITPAITSVATGGQQPFTAQGYDQNGAAMTATYSWTSTGGSMSSATGSSSTYTAGTTAGSYLVTVTATAGGTSKSASAAVTVTSTPPPPPPPTGDTTPPTLNWTNMVSGEYDNGLCCPNVAASDASGIAKVVFYVDGVSKATDTTAPYDFYWMTTSYTNGLHILKAEAFDTVGNSASITCNVYIIN